MTSVDLRTVDRALSDPGTGLLAVPVVAGRRWGPGALALVQGLGSWVSGFLDARGFTGELGQIEILPSAGALPFAAACLVGLGHEASTESVRRAAGWLGRHTRNVARVCTTLPQVAVPGAVEATIEGFLLGQYRFRDDPRAADSPGTKRLSLLVDDPRQNEDAAARGQVLADAALFARDLTNEAPAAKTPALLAAIAEGRAREAGLHIQILDEDGIREERLAGLLGVAAGSHHPPRLVALRHRPEGAVARLVIVGKGITFDSGGLSLKSAEAMEPMKTDMAGAAAALAAVSAIARLGVPVEVTCLLPLAENMPGGGAQRPGDIIPFRNGKVVEVVNTDAEGRLVLADGLALAAECSPDLLVDIATLTGACEIALGLRIAGLWSNDDRARQIVLAASERCGERVWPMPLEEDIRADIDSRVAHLKNRGPKEGGAITAALFLREFVGSVPWVHLDIAGPADWRADDQHYVSKGGTGFGARLLVAIAEELARTTSVPHRSG